MAEEEKIRAHAKQALQVLTDKTKKWKDRIKEFLWEVFIILVAVNITLWFHNWNEKKHEKRDMALYLNAIKLELEENITTIDRSIEYLLPNVEYEKYLQNHDKKSLNEDTLAYYAVSCCYNLKKFTFKTNAFEMYKSSGVMRLIDDKELSLSIWEVYSSIVSLNESLKWHFDTKWRYMEKDFVFAESGMLDISKLTNKAPMYSFYNSGFSSSMLKDSEETLKETKEAVSKLEKYPYLYSVKNIY